MSIGPWRRTDRTAAGRTVAAEWRLRRSGAAAVGSALLLGLFLLGAGGATAAVAAPTPTGAPPTTAGPAPSPSPSATPGVVFSAGFESGTDGFTGLPSTVHVTTTAPGETGARSLLVGSMTGYGQGTTVTLPAGLPSGWFSAFASVRLPSGKAQDFRLSLAGPSAAVPTRARADWWTGVSAYFSANGSTPITLNLTPVAFCSDAPATPLPFQVDHVFVRYLGVLPPPQPLLPTPTCPLDPGSSSSPSISPSTSTSPSTQPPVGCQISDTVTPWNGGYQSSITITNLTDAPITGWTLRLTLPAGDRVTSLWPGPYRQDGTTLTATNPAWSPVLAPGKPFSLGFVASRTGSGPVGFPTDITLNGAPCRYPIV